MKQYFKAILLIMFCTILLQNFASGQDSTSLYQFVPANFKGGEEVFSKYIERKIKIKQFVDYNILKGRCSFSFKISTDGKIDCIGFSKKSDSCFFEKELFGVFIWSEGWKPALFNQKPIDSYIEADMFFKYNMDDKEIQFNTKFNLIKEYQFESNLYNEALSMQTKGKFNLAILLYKEALDIREEDSLALMNYGICTLKLKDTVEACKIWNRMKSYSFNLADSVLNKYCGNNSIVAKMDVKKIEYPGGESMFYKYITANAQYPQMERENGIQGTVYLAANADTNGVVKRIWIMRGVKGGPSLGLEATRILLSMPNWKPKIINGKKVDDLIMIPMRFTLR